MQSGIYKISHIESGRFYIGSAKNIKARWSTHRQDLIKNKHHSKYLQAIYNKYGKDSIVYEVIEYCELNDLLIREQYHIDTLTPELNTVKIAGSPKGYKHSEETKRKQSERQRGRKVTFSEEAIANIREGHKNRIYSIEAKLKMSLTAKRNNNLKPTVESIAKVAAFHTGRKRSEETKRKISEARKGKQISPEGLAKMKVKMQSPEMREHLSKLAKLRPAPKGHPMSDEQKKHLSQLKKGIPLSEEHKRNLRESRPKDFKHSEETKNKIRLQKLKFTKEQVITIRNLYQNGTSMAKLGKLYGVMRHTISRVIKGKSLYANY